MAHQTPGAGGIAAIAVACMAVGVIGALVTSQALVLLPVTAGVYVGLMAVRSINS